MSRVLFLFVLACSGKEVEDSNDVPPINRQDSEDVPCNGHNPVAVELLVGNGGIQQFDEGPYPTVSLEVPTTDEDGNLNYVTLEFWWDATIDDAVDTSASAQVTQTQTITSAPCLSTEQTPSLLIQVGTGLQYNTLYDFAARVTDAEGEASNVVVASGSTPRENGLAGDGSGP